MRQVFSQPEIAIDSDVPLPADRRTLADWPFLDMKVGQSFFAPGMSAREMGSPVHRFRKKHGMQYTFVTRSVIEGGVAGCRIWRTK